MFWQLTTPQNNVFLVVLQTPSLRSSRGFAGHVIRLARWDVWARHSLTVYSAHGRPMRHHGAALIGVGQINSNLLVESVTTALRCVQPRPRRHPPRCSWTRMVQ